ncbi:MAG TPA: SUMF1/EgtB/PvdO family nonheme iron enzyme [Opitutales bacterium]|jgi:hypothetical protein|nr:SUMF1/EgtB/PvdO family nonheme iron enzyme [Opitutales bacterium]
MFPAFHFHKTYYARLASIALLFLLGGCHAPDGQTDSQTVIPAVSAIGVQQSQDSDIKTSIDGLSLALVDDLNKHDRSSTLVADLLEHLSKDDPSYPGWTDVVKGKKMRVAVLPFKGADAQGNYFLGKDLTATIRSRVAYDLFEKFDMVDESDTETALTEMGIQDDRRGEMAPEAIIKVGRLLGTQAVIKGEILEAGSAYQVKLVLVLIPTGGEAGTGIALFTKGRPVASQQDRPNISIATGGGQYIGPELGKPWTVPGYYIDMVWIQPGSFSPGNDNDGYLPVSVTLTKGFWLGRYEVTQEEWKAVMDNNNPSFSTYNSRCPVEQVSWDDAVEFCKKLTTEEQNANRISKGLIFTLPTEAQWEYACQAGSSDSAAFLCRPASRLIAPASTRNGVVGFRLALVDVGK